jgi:hypothetical protein
LPSRSENVSIIHCRDARAKVNANIGLKEEKREGSPDERENPGGVREGRDKDKFHNLLAKPPVFMEMLTFILTNFLQTCDIS